MKTGVKLLLPLITSALLLFAVQNVSAHPGKTAADGCHVCKTNCTKWGEVEGARHCHNGGGTVTQNSPTPKPTVAPTKNPSPRPVIINSTPSPNETNTPQPEPEYNQLLNEGSTPAPDVLGTSTKNESSIGGAFSSLVTLSLLIGLPYLGIKKLIKKYKSK